MKNLMKLGMALLIAAMVLGFGGCWDTEPDGKTGNSASGKDFTNHATNGRIHVRNLTSENLLAYRDSISDATFIGGINAKAEGWGLRNDNVLGSLPVGFTMVLITEQQYLDNKDGKITNTQLREAPLCRVYVYYNPNRRADDPIKNYEISGNLGGSNRLAVDNNTKYSVELRLGGVDGETIGFAPTGLITSYIYLSAGDFDLFPVFKSYNAARDAITTYYPKGSSGYPWFKGVTFGEGSGDQRFEVQDAANSLSGGTMGAAWVAVRNGAQTAVRVLRGSTAITGAMTSMTGVSYIGEGASTTFQFNMEAISIGDNQAFASSTTIDNIRIGPSGFTVQLKTEAGAVTNIVLQTDRMYTINVRGSHNDSSLEAVINMQPYDQTTNPTGWTAVTFD